MSSSMLIMNLSVLLLLCIYFEIINAYPLSPLCDCYDIVLKHMIENDKNENCWTYSIEFNDALDICKEKRAKAIILGRCHEKPKFNMKKLRKSIMSVYPNNYETKIFKSSRDSLLGLRIRDIDYSKNIPIKSNEEITLCMKYTNDDGLTSNNIQYKLFDDNVITCFNSQFHSGLPCFKEEEEEEEEEDDHHQSASIETIKSYPTPSTSSPIMCKMNNLHDLCIIFDQSCSLSNTECDIYLNLIAQFIESIKNGNNNQRLCLLGISSGVQILINLNDNNNNNNNNNNINDILNLIVNQRCGNTNTNLLDALEIAQFKFDTITPKSNYKSLVIFNSCISTDSDGNFNENDICNKYKSKNKNIINKYIINIQSLNGSVIGKTNFLPSGNIDPNKYLQCLINNNSNHLVSITQNNYKNAYGIIDDITKQICNDHNMIINAESNNLLNIDFISMENESKLNKNKALSKTTINIIKFVFIFVMIIIIFNAMCCSFFALRQSGSLDNCFGDINKEIDQYNDTDDDIINLEDIQNINNEISDIKLKKYLNERGHGPFSKYNNNRSRHLKQNAPIPLELSIFIQDLNLNLNEIS